MVYFKRLSMKQIKHNFFGRSESDFKGSSRKKLYQELELAHLYQIRWVRMLILADMLIGLIGFLADLNISRTLSFLMTLMNGIN